MQVRRYSTKRMKKELIEGQAYPDGSPVHTGDICTAEINQRMHICIWVRGAMDRRVFELVPIDFKVGELYGQILYTNSRFLGNIYDMAGTV